MTGVKTPVLTIHGSKDRSAPYGGGREWALRLANARLLTVGQAAHAPWIEAPELTFGSIKTFLDGTWPEAAEKVTSLDPDDPSIVP
jgi:pimeloyl-ACP methyl ester carboxylesterase